MLSIERHNRVTGMAVLCPITGQRKNYPFEVRLPAGLAVSGVVLCNQVKSLEWEGRDIEHITTLPAELTARILATVRRLLD